MISIQSIMLVALGFLSAVLLALVIAPAYRNRAVRLSTQRLKERLPLDENEVRADKDRLRATYAIKVHKLEMLVDRSKLEKARQTIEIHRRDGKISQLEQVQSRLVAQVDENLNARRVLEQTVADRLPKVEARLNEAKSILFNRDREIADLTQSSKSQRLALEEAHSINAQQTAELERMTNALTVRGARNQGALPDSGFEGELALRAEIEALRSKTREQAGLIGRLQAQMGRGALLALPPGAERAPPLNGYDYSGAGKMDARPGEAKATSLAVVMSQDDVRSDYERQVRGLKSKIDDQANDLARLNAEVATLRAGADGDMALSGLKDSKIALKARLNAAQAQAEQATDQVKRLRAELAAAHERLALQGAHFMEQMKRLGAGSLPASGQTRRPVTQGSKLTLAERVAQSPTRNGADTAQARTDVEFVETDSIDDGTAFILPLQSPQGGLAQAAAPANGSQVPHAASSSSAVLPESAPAAVDAPPPPRKPRLIDRISNINKA